VKFKYTAKNFGGQTVRGVVEASSIVSAVALIREQKLVPVGLVPVKDHIAAVTNLNQMLGKVSASDLANFTRQLSTMITAGLPLTDALNLLKVQSGPAMAPVVGGVLADVQSGVALSAAMAKHPKVFSRVYVALIRAGETAGIMEKIMMRLAENSEKSREFRSKVIGAMIYPIIILIGMVVVVAVMMVVVIPKLSALYADFGSELPVTTQVVIAISNFSVKYWWLVVLGVAGLGMAFRALINTEAGRFQWDAFLYKLPVTGPLARQVMLTEMTRTMGLLIGAGVSVVEALNIVAEASGNVVVKKELIRVAKQVEKGFPVSISFSESEIFPPLIGQMVAVGEETGKLDDVLAKLSGYFESESTEKIKGLTTAIEPLILVVLAVGVGFLMYAIIIPIYQITDQI
jgi:type II secretory pathway component PulF